MLISYQKMLTDLPCKSCNYCSRHTEEWQEFKSEVSTTVALVSRSNIFCQRITTRSLGGTSNINSIPTWLSEHTIQEVQQLQREDVDLRVVHLWFDEGDRPSRNKVDQYSPAVRTYYLRWDSLQRENGMIYNKLYPDDNKQPVHEQLIVPKVLRQQVLQQCHKTVLGGHLSVTKTISKIRQEFLLVWVD